MIAAFRVLLIAVVLCFWGVKNLRTPQKAHEPTVATAREYLSDVPKDGWYTIKGATLSLFHARYAVRVDRTERPGTKHSAREAQTLYLPVYTDDTIGRPTTLVLKTENPVYRATLAELERNNRTMSETAFRAWVEKNKERLDIHCDLKGVIGHMVPAELELVEFAGRDTAAKFYILHEGAEPARPVPQNGVGILITGVVLGVLGTGMLVSALKERGSQTRDYR
jgi:hypothetical protein